MDNDDNLFPYRVTLHEEDGDKHHLAFDCLAEDPDHAAEQAQNAYPGAVIVSATALDDAVAHFLIYSPNESATSDGAGFWNDLHGWASFDLATKFTLADRHTKALPCAVGGDARWVYGHEAR